MTNSLYVFTMYAPYRVSQNYYLYYIRTVEFSLCYNHVCMSQVQPEAVSKNFFNVHV